MALSNLILLSRLRKAIEKVRFLLNFNIHRWRHLRSILRLPSRQLPSRRQLSLSNSSGLLDFTVGARDCELGLSPSTSIQRTSSGSGGDYDIDKKAQEFIENFYRHIQMERQVSLQLRYARGSNMLQRTNSD